MSLYCRIAQLDDLDEILDFENKKLISTVPDETERTFQSWHARWRREALEHYLPLGWSFLARDPETSTESSKEGVLVGYFLAQPFLFMEGHTQSLWMEHLAHSSLQARDELCNLAYKLSREKHFQRVLFPNISGVGNSVKTMMPEQWQPSVFNVKTVK